MRQLVGVLGSGLIGTDPFDFRCWSGISRRLFLECQDRGLLRRAFGVEVGKLSKAWFAFKNLSTGREKWRTQFYSDPGYRSALTKRIEKELTEQDYGCDLLQLGAMYDTPDVVKGRTACYSYNDGNFSMLLHSPYFPRGIAKSKIEATLRYEADVNKRLDKVLTMSEYLRQSFINDYGVNPDKAVCIGAGINLDELPDIDENKDYSNGTILFIGIEFERKGGYHLLEAFKVVRQNIPNATLHVVGPKNVAPGCENLPGLVWHGYLSKYSHAEMAELSMLFRNAALFVMPSLYEPFGIAPLEAMAHGIPCVVSRAWALPEIVPDGVCGALVEPGDSEELSSAIIDLLKDPQRLSRYGAASRHHVETKYTWPAVVERLRLCMS